MKKLDIYLLQQFLSVLLISLLGFLSIFIIVDLIENLDRYIDNKMPWGIVIKYYGYSLPWFVNIALPMSMMIATVFSIGLMAKRNEWTAMKSAGISLYRISVTLLSFSILISILSFKFDYSYVSWGMENRSIIEKKYMKKKPRRRIKKTFKNILFQQDKVNHISIRSFNHERRKARGITVITFQNNKMRQRFDSKSMVWVEALEGWSAKDFSLRSFDSLGVEKSVTVAKTDTLIHFGFTIEDLTKGSKLPDELNYTELEKRIEYLKSNGVDATRWIVQRHFKVAFAFTNMIVVLFGIPLVVVRPRSGLAFGAGMSFLVLFSYYAFIKFGQSLGIKGVMDPMLSAWIGNIVFLIGGVLLLFSVRK